jgi:hypothetical protein
VITADAFKQESVATVYQTAKILPTNLDVYAAQTNSNVGTVLVYLADIDVIMNVIVWMRLMKSVVVWQIARCLVQ